MTCQEAGVVLVVGHNAGQEVLLQCTVLMDVHDTVGADIFDGGEVLHQSSTPHQVETDWHGCLLRPTPTIIVKLLPCVAGAAAAVIIASHKSSLLGGESHVL